MIYPEILYQKKFFYDNFSEEDIAGMYSVEHIVYMIVFFLAIAALLYFSRNISNKQYDRIHTGIAISATALEIIKIALAIYKREPYDNWIPFYFCGLFLFSVWMAKSKIPFLQNTGYSYITMGGIIAGIIFTFYPSTSLLLYPIWHPSTIHAALYHGAMIYFGVITLLGGRYEPRGKHAKNYFVFISIVCIISVFLNKYLGTNCMFMRDPFGMPLLAEIERMSKPVYMILAWFGQAVALYWFNLWVYRNIKNRIASKSEQEQTKATITK